MKHNWKKLTKGTRNLHLFSCKTCGFQIVTENEIEASKFSPPCSKNCAKCGKSFDEVPLGTFHGLVDEPTKELLCVGCM